MFGLALDGTSTGCTREVCMSLERYNGRSCMALPLINYDSDEDPVYAYQTYSSQVARCLDPSAKSNRGKHLQFPRSILKLGMKDTVDSTYFEPHDPSHNVDDVRYQMHDLIPPLCPWKILRNDLRIEGYP